METAVDDEPITRRGVPSSKRRRRAVGPRRRHARLLQLDQVVGKVGGLHTGIRLHVRIARHAGRAPGGVTSCGRGCARHGRANGRGCGHPRSPARTRRSSECSSPPPASAAPSTTSSGARTTRTPDTPVFLAIELRGKPVKARFKTGPSVGTCRGWRDTSKRSSERRGSGARNYPELAKEPRSLIVLKVTAVNNDTPAPSSGPRDRGRNLGRGCCPRQKEPLSHPTCVRSPMISSPRLHHAVLSADAHTQGP